MQAIVELFVAPLAGLVQALVGAVVALIELAVLTVEFLLVALTQGIQAAREQTRESRERR